MTYRVRIYCHMSFEIGSCNHHEPPHPIIARRTFDSITAASEYAEDLVAEMEDDDIEWEEINEDGAVVQ